MPRLSSEENRDQLEDTVIPTHQQPKSWRTRWSPWSWWSTQEPEPILKPQDEAPISREAESQDISEPQSYDVDPQNSWAHEPLPAEPEPSKAVRAEETVEDVEPEKRAIKETVTETPSLKVLGPEEPVSKESVAGGIIPDKRTPEELQLDQHGASSTKPQTTKTASNVALIPPHPDFRRLDSERREKLCEVQDCRHVIPMVSQSRTRAVSALPEPKAKRQAMSQSFSDLRSLTVKTGLESDDNNYGEQAHPSKIDDKAMSTLEMMAGEEPEVSSPLKKQPGDSESASEAFEDETFRQELQAKWVLSLSMHFRDGSDREKFFITYVEYPNRWRRVTVSCDYRNAENGSLESDLRTLHYQRDKNARIYESIRDSLPDIQFYETVTNLKLQTKDKRLHVHVTEDMNEIIHYPRVSAIAHLDFESQGFLQVRESDVYFESHLSGFVYRVSVYNRTFIKKEIPSPDTVEEFLYEINALARLRRSQGVINLVGVVVDDSVTIVKGLLIEWARGGSLNDFLFENQHQDVPWPRRAKWARQIIEGIRDIHESGFVQGDCTLSNIVLDSEDNAKIVDINRRGCPIGWEPPEFEGLIRSGQRVSIYIGVKSDLFQLGMILWAIAKQVEEPEREEKPLLLDTNNVPPFYKNIVDSCLSHQPSKRMSAKDLLSQFPSPGEDEMNLDLSVPAERVPTRSGNVLHYPFSPLEFDNHRRQIPWGRGMSDDISQSDLPIELQQNQQEIELAGIGQFENREGSTKYSDSPVDEKYMLSPARHQDSGFDAGLGFDRDLPSFQAADLFTEEPNEVNSSARATLHSQEPSRLINPVHKDSGLVLDDTTSAALQEYRQTAFSSSAHQSQSFSPSQAMSHPIAANEDLLFGIGGHAGDGDGNSNVP